MGIPESQLAAWSRQGATTGSAETYKSITNAFASHQWPSGMSYDAYLQGSYPNATNIRGNSDVDLAVQTDSVYYHNLTVEDRTCVGWSPGAFGWQDFRVEVVRALEAYYQPRMVDSSGNKCIRVLPSGNRLPVDVVPCVEYRRYHNDAVAARGMTFWTKSGIQVVNYPKLHLANGAAKNQRASSRFKPAVRMFKNARDQLNGSAAVYPSYFLECLLYNVPDSCFASSLAKTFEGALRFLCERRDSNKLQEFVTVSGQHYLFGSSMVQSNESEARELINSLVGLWNNW